MKMLCTGATVIYFKKVNKMKHPETAARDFILLNFPDAKAEKVMDLIKTFIAGYRKGEEAKRKRRSKRNAYELIIEIVFGYYGLDKKLGKEKNRKREIVQARQISYYEGARLTNLSYQSMADNFNQDHATCLHGIRHIKDLIVANPPVKKDIKEIEKQILEKINIPIDKE